MVLIEYILPENKINAADVYNMDETGIALGSCGDVRAIGNASSSLFLKRAPISMPSTYPSFGPFVHEHKQRNETAIIVRTLFRNYAQMQRQIFSKTPPMMQFYLVWT